MEKIPDEKLVSPNSTTSGWKFWLGLILFIAFVVGINIENHSDEGRARRVQTYNNGVKAVYEETYSACKEDGDENCRQHAERWAEIARKKLNP